MRQMNLLGQTCNFPDHKIDHHQTSCSDAFETDLHSLHEIELRCNRNKATTTFFALISRSGISH
jgi:endonuclease I